MLFEDIMLLLLASSTVFLIGIPCYKFVKAVLPQRRNPLEEAKERLEQARLEAEAAKLNKESERIYEQMYNEALEDENVTNNNETRRKL